MGISFSFKNDIQYVKIEGLLSAVEEAAVRLKLDQKINQGRIKILIDISLFSNDDKDSILGLQTILAFAVLRETQIGLFGLKNTFWVAVAEGFQGKMQLFETEDEALKWFVANAAKKEAPEMPKKASPEDEIKQKLLKKLLETYEIYQAKNDFDPHLLKKLDQVYAQAPQKEPIFALRRAFKNIFSLTTSLETLEHRCRELADQLLKSMRTRKIPLSQTELHAKQKTNQDVKSAIQTELTDLQKEIGAKNAATADFKRRSTQAEDHWKTELEILQRQIETQKAENEKLREQLPKS